MTRGRSVSPRRGGVRDEPRHDHGAADDATDAAAYLEAVLDLVERIPPGRVMSYGAIAEYLQVRFGRGSARRVGTIMALHGGAVPWHRVVNAAGRLPPGHERAARGQLESEGAQFRGEHVAMAACAWWPDDHKIAVIIRLGSEKPG